MSTPVDSGQRFILGGGRARILPQPEVNSVGKRETSSSTTSDDQEQVFFDLESGHDRGKDIGFGTPTIPVNRRGATMSTVISRQTTEARSSQSASLSSFSVRDTTAQEGINPSYDPHAQMKLQTQASPTTTANTEKVVARDHESEIGKTAHLEIEDRVAYVKHPVECMAFSQTQPVELQVDSLICRAIHQFPKLLDNFSKSVNVTFKVQLDHIVVTPSKSAHTNWRSMCEEFLSKTFSKCKMEVPKELGEEIRKKFDTYKHEYAFTSEPMNEANQSVCYILAGEVKVLKALQEHKNTLLSSVEDTLDLIAEAYDFVKELKVDKIRSDCPSVQYDLHVTPKFKISFKGPLFHVKQAKQELSQFIQNLKIIPVEMDNKLVDHFASTEGKKQLREFIHMKHCPMVPSFGCRSIVLTHSSASKVTDGNDAVLSLAFVCESVHSDFASSVTNDLMKESRYEEIPVPENLSSSIDKMKEYKTLVSQLKRIHHTIITYNISEKTIFVYGFSEGVAVTCSSLENFIQQRKSLSAPLELPVSKLLCKALQKHPRNLEQILADCNPNLSYTFSDDEMEILISCKGIIEGDWKHRLQAAIQKYTNNFLLVKVYFNCDAEKEISKYLSDIEQSQQTPFAFDLQVESALVEIVGESSVLEGVERGVEKISSLYANLSRKFPVQPVVHAYLKQIKLRHIKTNHPGLTFSLDAKFLLVEGPQAKLIELDEHLSTYLNFVSVPVSTDTLLVEFLSEGCGKEFLKTFLESKGGIPIAIFSTTSNLDFLCDYADEDAVRAVVVELRLAITVRNFPLPHSLRQPNPEVEARLEEFCSKIKENCYVVVSLRSGIIEIGGKVDDVTKAVEEMNDFVIDVSTTKLDVQLSSPQWRLIQKAELWIQRIKQFFDEVDVLEDGSQITQVRVHLKGEDSKVTTVYEQLLELKDSVKIGSINVSAPGACKYFHFTSTKPTILSGIESHYSVCIETVSQRNAVNGNASQVYDATEYCRVSTQFEKTGNTIIFKVYTGDLTEFEADVIVNPANGSLVHSGGLAAAIVKKGGEEIQTDCNQYVLSLSCKLSDGDVYFSSVVGQLRCKAIVHAVGPEWQTRSKNHKYEKEHLRKAVLNSLARATNYNSIAFPAISSGIFQYPIDECAFVHTETAVNYFKTTKTVLKEVSFVVNDQVQVRAFYSALSQFFPGKVISMYLDADTNPSPANSVKLKDVQPMKMRAPCLLQGDLFSTKVTIDVYVCTANTNLDLSRGTVAKRMSKLAGPSLQKECSDKGSANPGDVVVTGPGKLKCQYVFHAVASVYDSDKDGKILRSLMQRCFEECEKNQVNSIAFPAIGPGVLGYPINLVAKIMISESCKYLARTKNPLFHVYLVIYKETQYKVLQKELKNAQTTSSIEETSLTISAPVDTDTEAVPASTTADFLIKGIQVSVVKGDITKDSSDAIVNTASPSINLSKSGQVSKMLLRTAGSKLQDLCKAAVKREGQLTEGKVIHTKALTPLQCTSLFHIYFYSNNPVKYVETINACLVKAEQLQYKTIAFPAIGTGLLKFPNTEAAKGFLAGIKQFSLTNPQHVKQVRIVILNEAIYDEFLTAIQPNDIGSTPRQADAVSKIVAGANASDAQLASEPESEDLTHKIDKETGPLSSSSPGSSTEIVNVPNLHVAPQTGIKLLICGFDEGKVAGATKELNRLIAENCKEDEIQDETIRAFKPAECQDIIKECEASSVEYTIETETGRIQLRGNVNDVSKIKSNIYGTIHRVMSRRTEERDKERQHQFEVDTCYQSVHWQYKKAGTAKFEDYDREISYAIEQAFQQYQGDRHRYIFHYSEDISFNFKKRKEEDRRTKQSTPVRRFLTNEDGRRPENWVDMPARKVVVCVDLQADDIEYKQVVDAFNKTMIKGGNYSRIVKIQRVQNPRLYGLYQKAKAEMERANPPGRTNERQLFHGTNVKSMEKINANGFNRSYAGKHAKVYGVGTYFAQDASYSAQPTYSEPDGKGCKYMYYARVLVGEYTVGKSSMMVPPAKNPRKNPNILFDSLVDNLAVPSIFVVGPDAQSYPEYLIIFK